MTSGLWTQILSKYLTHTDELLSRASIQAARYSAASRRNVLRTRRPHSPSRRWQLAPAATSEHSQIGQSKDLRSANNLPSPQPCHACDPTTRTRNFEVVGTSPFLSHCRITIPSHVQIRAVSDHASPRL